MTCDPGEDYDMSGMFLAEERKCSFDEIDLAEEDDFELIADEVLGRKIGGELFDCAYDRCSISIPDKIARMMRD